MASLPVTLESELASLPVTLDLEAACVARQPAALWLALLPPLAQLPPQCPAARRGNPRTRLSVQASPLIPSIAESQLKKSLIVREKLGLDEDTGALTDLSGLKKTEHHVSIVTAVVCRLGSETCDAATRSL